MARVSLPLLLLAGVLATCPGTPVCSGIGYCDKEKCFCGLRHGAPDCSFVFASLASNPVVLLLQWAGFVWYLILLIKCTYCLGKIARVKGLKWLILDVHSHEVDPQQIPLLFAFLHCLLATASFGYDPYFVKPTGSTVVTSTLFLVEAMVLFLILFSLIRFWVHLQTKFQHDTVSLFAMRAYDVAFGVFVIVEVSGLSLLASANQRPPSDPRSTTLNFQGSFLGGLGYGLYIVYLLCFGLNYGCKMREYLQHSSANAGNMNEAARNTLTALRKLTRLLIVLCVVGGVSLILIIINVLVSYGSFGKALLNSWYSGVSLYITLHIAFGIFVVVILLTVGNADPKHYQHRSAGYSKKSPTKVGKMTHISKKSVQREHHVDLTSLSVEGPHIDFVSVAGGQERTKPYMSDRGKAEPSSRDLAMRSSSQPEEHVQRSSQPEEHALRSSQPEDHARRSSELERGNKGAQGREAHRGTGGEAHKGGDQHAQRESQTEEVQQAQKAIPSQEEGVGEGEAKGKGDGIQTAGQDKVDQEEIQIVSAV